MRISLAFLGALQFAAATLCAQQQPGLVFSPVASPILPDVVAFERLDNDRRELHFLRASNQQVFSAVKAAKAAIRGMVVALPEISGGANLAVYSGELDWRPVAEQGRSWFAYVSSDDRGGVGLLLNYIDRDGQLAKTDPLRVTFDGAVRFPRWSPDGRHLVFVSDSSVLHIIPDVDQALRAGNASKLRAIRVTEASRPALFPAWSPLGDHIAYGIETTTRGNRNGAIEVLPVNKLTGRVSGVPVIATEELSGDNEYRPAWSPDGKYIAFYVDQSGQSGSERQSDIGVVEVVVNPRDGRIFRGEVKEGWSRWLADDVIPNEGRGPSWTTITVGTQPKPAIAYVQRSAERNHPVVAAALDSWLARETREKFASEISEPWGTVNHKSVSSTEMNLMMRYVYVSVQGGGETVEFHDNVADWAKGPDPKPIVVASKKADQKETGVLVIYAHKGQDVAKALVFPGLGQRSAGQPKKAWIFAAAGVTGAALCAMGISQSGPYLQQGKDAIKAENVQSSAANKAKFDTAQDGFKTPHTLATAGAALYAAAWLGGVLDVSIGSPAGASRLTIGVVPDRTRGSNSAAGQFGVRIPFGGVRH